MHAFPGPVHYAGDQLTLQIPFQGFVEPVTGQVKLTVDGTVSEIEGEWRFNYLLLPEAVDTANMLGEHSLRVEATHDETTIDVEYVFAVLPSDQRPVQEADLQWLVEVTPCCEVHFLSETAAARDIASIVDLAQQAADDIAQATGIRLDGAMQIYLFDRMWGNGAFGGNGELAVAYFDRGYGPAQGKPGLLTLFRHELTHATGVDVSQTLGTFFRYNEGLAVYLAGGHYKPEPLQQRGAAMVEMGFDGDLNGEGFVNGHELAYLHAAALVAYVVEEYGWQTFLEFRDAAVFETFYDPVQMELVVAQVFNLSLQDFEQGFMDWLTVLDAGEQTIDLQLTIDLQDLRRDYQRRFAPQPEFVFGAAESSFGLPSAMPSLVREARSAAHQAVELMIADGQQAIVEGNYAQAQLLVEAVGNALQTGSFVTPIGSYYASAVETLTGQGYEVVQLVFDETGADAWVTLEAPNVDEVRLRLEGETWSLVE